MRGDSPTPECIAQWATPEPTTAPTTQSPAETSGNLEKPEKVSLVEESFATALALTALALYA